MSEDRKKLLEIRHLKKYFSPGTRKEVRAVDDISFDIYEGETFGLVGESGCGKSTTGRTIIQLYDRTDGEILFNGKNVFQMKGASERDVLRRDIQMIFQDPFASIDPHFTAKDIIAEGMDVHHLYKTRAERDQKVYDLLEEVGLTREHAERNPHEFSGGQRQRIGIARALAVSPKLIIADEPISALDVSIQAQVVNLLKRIQRQKGLTYLFIAHDLSMVKYISDRIAVMHKGKIVELADSDELYCSPLHPYTKSLLSAIPQPDPIFERKRQRIDYQWREEQGDTGKLYEISPKHFVFCLEDEIADYHRKYNALKK
ncbi:ABC transporter ATP-binding protein [Sporolactobacillus pectinivorans]|uniref:ABC transporter ATP-binding protein n=1 Tax=Sporolactobacillus pectinivorans TaxID=1591408 RepID=UPI000C263EB2|nr:ATP-binding cassette domain-containing protein [Sporolactobacillus pectinivorans]